MAKVEEPNIIENVSVKLLRANDVNSIIEIINTNGYGSIEKLSDAILMIGILANALKELKQQLESRNII